MRPADPKAADRLHERRRANAPSRRPRQLPSLNVKPPLVIKPLVRAKPEEPLTGRLTRAFFACVRPGIRPERPRLPSPPANPALACQLPQAFLSVVDLPGKANRCNVNTATRRHEGGNPAGLDSNLRRYVRLSEGKKPSHALLLLLRRKCSQQESNV